MSGEFSIQPLVPGDLPEALDALNEAFGSGFDESWYRWKHLSGPYGSSWAWIARDVEGLLGLRILLPWRFRGPRGELAAARPCDTVTVPRARGRGVFRSLTEFALDQLAGEVDLLFNTPNENSLPGYLKMGFRPWSEVSTKFALVRHERSELTEHIGVPPETADVVETVRSPSFMEWRYERCPVYQYRGFSLANADHENGAVARVRQTKGRRVVVFAELWGPEQSRTVLVRSVCRALGSRIAFLTEQSHNSPFVWDGGKTVVTTRRIGSVEPEHAIFGIGDIEDVL